MSSLSLFDDSTKQLNEMKLNERLFVLKLFISQHAQGGEMRTGEAQQFQF